MTDDEESAFWWGVPADPSGFPWWLGIIWLVGIYALWKASGHH